MADILLFHFSTIKSYLQENKQVARASAALIGTGITVHFGRKLYAIHKKSQLRSKKIKQREDSITRWIKLVNSDAVSMFYIITDLLSLISRSCYSSISFYLLEIEVDIN